MYYNVLTRAPENGMIPGNRARGSWGTDPFALSILREEQSMCGIVGYTGRRQAAPILLDGLARLEYRG